MIDYDYLSSIFNYLGILINNVLKQEIIYYFPLVFSEKTNKYEFKNTYSIITQSLGTFFVDFINTDFDNIEEFKDFFFKYYFCILDDNYKKISKNSFNKIELENFISKLYSKKSSKLKRVQEQLDEIMDYCIINPRKKNKSFTALDRFVVLQTVHENLTILRENKMESMIFYKINGIPIANKSENELYTILDNRQNKVEKITVSIPHSIESLIYFTLCNIMENKLFFKVCKNCNNYFISSNSKIEYCDRTAPYSDKTCREVGRSSVFQKKLNSDPLLEEYYKIYSKKSMMARRNPDISKYVNDFERYRKIGKIKVSDYKSKKLSKQDFKNWLEKKI